MRQSHNIDQIHNYSIDIKSREIFLHSSLENGEEEGGIDYRSATFLHKNLRYLNTLSREPIIIHMHIPGGEWSDCMSMYDVIGLCESPVGIVVYSRAESSGSIILQGADIRIMMPSSYMLIHYGFTSLDTEHKAAVSSLEWSQKEASKMVDLFTDKFVESKLCKEKNWKRPIAKKHILSQLDNKTDWIMYPQECIDYGFADGILGSEEYPNIDSIKTYLKNNYI
jgi:ATP-dependent protease ClpP protease subunit